MDYLCLNSWAGRSLHPVKVIAETSKKYRVELLEDCPLAGRNRQGKRGDVILVPKYAVKLSQEDNQ